MNRTSFVILLTLLIVARLSAVPATTPTTAPGNYIVTRADVAMAYLELDRLYSQAKLSDEQRARVNRECDQATIAFFQNQPSQAVRMFHQVSATLAPDMSKTPEARVARAMRVRVAPWVAQEGRPTPLRILFHPMYSLPIETPVKLQLVIQPDPEFFAKEARPVFERQIDIDPRGMAPSLTVEQPDAPAGPYRVELVAPDGTRRLMCHWYVAEQPADYQRRKNMLDINTIKQDSQQILLATAAVAARNNLLSDQFSEAESARFTSDPLKLTREVAHEIQELSNDRDPFVGRAGDYWRTIILGSMHVPARVYAPESVIASGKPAPLVIALHGAGGEEALFMEAYGNGAIKRLADEKGFIVVAPSTYHSMTAPQPVEGLVQALSYDYLINPKRAYVIGHSLGAMTAQSYATRWPDRVAAACMIAGGTPFPNQKRMAPTLMIGADQDPILAGVGMNVKKVADEARRLGLPVEFRELPNEGHTLIVGDALPQAIDWLLKHELAGGQK
jgi:pimeloyl-ACP methyl ester carboxylesterase